MRSQRLAAVAVSGAPSFERERQKLLLGWRDAGGRALLVQPAAGLPGTPLDLPSELVADRAGSLDLTPHAGRDLHPGGERLLEALGREPGRHGLLRVRLEQRDRVLPSGDSEIGHGVVN